MTDLEKAIREHRVPADLGKAEAFPRVRITPGEAVRIASVLVKAARTIIRASKGGITDDERREIVEDVLDAVHVVLVAVVS